MTLPAELARSNIYQPASESRYNESRLQMNTFTTSLVCLTSAGQRSREQGGGTGFEGCLIEIMEDFGPEGGGGVMASLPARCCLPREADAASKLRIDDAPVNVCWPKAFIKQASDALHKGGVQLGMSLLQDTVWIFFDKFCIMERLRVFVRVEYEDAHENTVTLFNFFPPFIQFFSSRREKYFNYSVLSLSAAPIQAWEQTDKSSGPCVIHVTAGTVCLSFNLFFVC